MLATLYPNEPATTSFISDCTTPNYATHIFVHKLPLNSNLTAAGYDTLCCLRHSWATLRGFIGSAVQTGAICTCGRLILADGMSVHNPVSQAAGFGGKF